MRTGTSVASAVSISGMQAAAICGALLFALDAGASPPRFRVQVLPPLEGGSSSTANAINDAGQVVGASTTKGTGYPNAVTWIDGSVINITGNGVSGASANAINANGVVVGFSDSLGLNAFSWHNGVLTPLPQMNACCSNAMAINDAGVIAGQASIAGGTPNDGVIWSDDNIVPIGTLGGTVSLVYGMNNSGMIVGLSDFSNNGEYFPFVWGSGEMTPLPAGGGTFGAAVAINDSGLIVGYYQPGAFGQRAAKWVNRRLVPLASLGGTLSNASDVNEQGWIVGSSWTSPQASTTAALWIGDQGVDLSRHALLGAGDHLYDARGINESGQIVGEGIFDGSFRGYVLTPMQAGDVQGDNAINVTDLLAVISQWGACAMPTSVATCPADLNVDGAVNVSDLLLVIANWSA